MTTELVQHNARRIRLAAQALERFAKKAERITMQSSVINNHVQDEDVSDLLHTMQSHLRSLQVHIEKE